MLIYKLYILYYLFMKLNLLLFVEFLWCQVCYNIVLKSLYLLLVRRVQLKVFMYLYYKFSFCVMAHNCIRLCF